MLPWHCRLQYVIRFSVMPEFALQFAKDAASQLAYMQNVKPMYVLLCYCTEAFCLMSSKSHMFRAKAGAWSPFEICPLYAFSLLRLESAQTQRKALHGYKIINIHKRINTNKNIFASAFKDTQKTKQIKHASQSNYFK